MSNLDNTQELDEILNWHSRCREELEAKAPGYADPKYAEEMYDSIVRGHKTQAKQAVLDWHNKQRLYTEAELQQEIAKAFEQGRKVGQYQTAETLYGDVTNIYLFKDGGTIKDLKLKQNADDHARELLKDCERYMNENSRAYADYLRTLKEHKEQ